MVAILCVRGAELLSPPHAQCCQTIRGQRVELGPEIPHGRQTEAEADSADAFEFSNEEYLELVEDMDEEELLASAAARAAPRRALSCSSRVGTGHGTWRARPLSPLLPLLLLLVGSWAGVPGLGSARRHLYYMISTLPAREGTSP